MPKNRKSKNQKRQEEKEVNETSSSCDDIYEESFMIAYQKKNGGDWEQVKIPYKRKKKHL
jgi:hypothetical protein